MPPRRIGTAASFLIPAAVTAHLGACCRVPTFGVTGAALRWWNLGGNEMDNNEAIAAQAMLSGLSDEPDQWRDPLAAFRALWAAQERALAGDDDGPMFWKF
jgi:hypothetical protein